MQELKGNLSLECGAQNLLNAKKCRKCDETLDRGKWRKLLEENKQMKKDIEFLKELAYESEKERTMLNQIFDLNKEPCKVYTIPKEKVDDDDKVIHRVVDTEEEFNELRNEVREFSKAHERYKRAIKAHGEQKENELWEQYKKRKEMSAKK